jgi:cytochrome c oxidase assembly protein subunit 15
MHNGGAALLLLLLVMLNYKTRITAQIASNRATSRLSAA